MKGHLIFLTMVTTMVTINTIIVNGFQLNDIILVAQLLILVVPGAFIVKTYLTIPLVTRVEKRFLVWIHHDLRQIFIFPALVMLVNSGVLTLISTILRNIGELPLLTHFLQGWGFKLVILFPLFFLVVRPLWNYIFAYVETIKVD